MKFQILALCLLLGTVYAGPVKESRASALDLLDMLENIVEDEGSQLITKIVYVIHKVEDGVIAVKNLVPKVYQHIHDEADEVLAELRVLANEVQDLLAKKTGGVYYGFDMLSGLTELTGNTKLSTVISVLQLADKAHRVANDAKDFVPHLQKELDKIQGKIEEHVTELAKHVLKELGLDRNVNELEFPFLGVAQKIEDLLDRVQAESHVLILNLLDEIEKTFALVKSDLPGIYLAVYDKIEQIERQAHEILADISKRLGLSSSYGILDIAGDFTHGTSLGTVIKVMSLVDKFNTVCQDIKGFGPHAEVLLQDSVKKVANHAQDFFTHSAKKFFE